MAAGAGLTLQERVIHVCACTGWTWHYVMHELDLPRLIELEAYWGKYPPLHLMVAGYLGIKPAQPAPEITEEINEEQFSHLLDNLPMSAPQQYMTTDAYLAAKERAGNGGQGR